MKEPLEIEMPNSSTSTLPSSRPNFERRMSAILKRLFDIVVSFLGLVVLSLFLGAIAFAIWRTDRKRVLFWGKRAGRNGKEFLIAKFRTMYENEASYQGAKITAQDDPRITPLGRWLRDTKINELPQLWNVLRGDMSLVGPRPEDVDIAAGWPEDVRREILSVRPGITSPASILYRDEEKRLHNQGVMDEYVNEILPSKLRLDQIYVRSRTFLGDLDIIFLTFIALIPRLGEVTVSESMLFWGPFSRLTSRHLYWLLLDVPIAFVSIALAGGIWRLGAPLDLGLGQAVMVAFFAALFFSAINGLLGINRIEWSRAQASDVFGLALSDGLATFILYLIDLINPVRQHLPLSLWSLFGVFTLLGFTAARYRLRLVTGLATRWLRYRGGATSLGERVLIVGAGDMGAVSAKLLMQIKFLPVFSIVGMVDDDLRKSGMRMEGCQVLGTTQDIPRLVDEKDIGVILFSITRIQPEKRKQVLALCRQTPARVVMIPDLLDVVSGYLRASITVEGDHVHTNGWDGCIPKQVVLDWLVEIEALTEADPNRAVDRIRQLVSLVQNPKRKEQV